MPTRTVKTQAELDAALKDRVGFIDINSPAGVWLEVRACESSTVWASGSSTVRASGSSTVRAYESSTVTAYGSSTVTAYDSSTVRASGSSTVTAYESSTVTASGSSTVTAYDSSTVTAYGSSTVTAYDSSTVEASKYVAVHLHSASVQLSGNGHVIDVTRVDTHSQDSWLDYYSPKHTKTRVTVYKAVDAELMAGQSRTPTKYPIGKTVKCPDWDAGSFCGNGLHFGPTPAHALKYYNGESEPRFLECTVPAKEFVALGDKIKAPSCRVVREVDEAMRPVGDSK